MTRLPSERSTAIKFQSASFPQCVPQWSLSPGGEGRGEGERAPGFIVEVLEAKEEAGEILAVESGRGRIIRASAKDAEILKPAPGSKHKRIRLTPGKFHYE